MLTAFAENFDFGHILWTMLIIFFMVIYFMILFTILSDLFRSPDLNGWFKAAWIIAILFLPFISMLIYLIVRGGGMAERGIEAQQKANVQMQEYAKSVVAQGGDATGSATDQINSAKALLDAGTITQEEFDKLKGKALDN